MYHIQNLIVIKTDETYKLNFHRISIVINKIDCKFKL